MAGSKSDYLENALLKHMAGITPYVAPVTWYVALFTAAPTDAGGGTECTGGSYARKSVVASNANFSVTGNVLTSITDIIFAALTGNIGTTVAFAIFDAVSGGNMLYWGDLAAGDQKLYVSGDQPMIPAGSVAIVED